MATISCLSRDLFSFQQGLHKPHLKVSDIQLQNWNGISKEVQIWTFLGIYLVPQVTCYCNICESASFHIKVFLPFLLRVGTSRLPKHLFSSTLAFLACASPQPHRCPSMLVWEARPGMGSRAVLCPQTGSTGRLLLFPLVFKQFGV